MATLHSSTPIKTREDRVIYRALSILKTRLREPDGETFASPSAVRDYLRLLLADEEREVFAALYLDAQNRLIEAETPFYGTLTQTSVYPREVVRRALYHNAAAVIFAHNHPSGVAEPSRADMLLTCGLKEALALVDVKVLDHFIVAGVDTLSFSEHGLLGECEIPRTAQLMTIKKQSKSRRKQQKAATAVTA
jgi:DNA repair protein RadC